MALFTTQHFPLLHTRGASASPAGLPPWPSPDTSAITPLLDTDLQYVHKPALAPAEAISESAQKAAEAETQPKAPELAVHTYKVQEGDTLLGIAAKLGVTSQTIVWANNLTAPDELSPDTDLRVPPVSGVLHTVHEGDTLLSLARRYQVPMEEILNYKGNHITSPDNLTEGEEIMVPGGVKPVDPPMRLASVDGGPGPAAPAPAPASILVPPPPPAPVARTVVTGSFQWPTYGPIFQYFSAYHKGLDISPPYGTPIYAADGGVVTTSVYGRDDYGYRVVVSHGSGLETWYAHMSAILVSAGQRVARGELLGRVGTTGRVTGPHLHFEVRLGGRPVNPLGYLPR